MNPIRRNVAHISQTERDNLINAIVQVDASKLFSDGVSYWDKQDQIHQVTHVHGGASFLPWHRELLNRFEAMLQEVDPTVALHYWDWTTDPRNSPDGAGGFVNLFTDTNFGSSSGRAGVPFDTLDNGGTLAGSRDQTGDPSDPPQEIKRFTLAGDPPADPDTDIISSADSLPQDQQWPHFKDVVEGSPNHNEIHGYIGGPDGTISPGHSSFEDPFVFLLHSNVDRLWAMWQTVPGQEWRLDPDQVYGDETEDDEITEHLEPWSGTARFGGPIPPWDPSDPDNEIVLKNSRDPSVVRPPCYDTIPTSVQLKAPVPGAPITFNAVPEGVTTVRAAVFEIRGCTDITLEIISGPGAGFDAPLGTSRTVPYSHNWPYEGRVWVSYTGTTAGSVAADSVTIRAVETGQEWVIPITAQTIARPKAASMLVLDKSGSMDWDSGIPGLRRLDVLRWAAPHFVHLMDDDDGIGIVAFDQDASPVMGVTAAGPPVFGTGRANALSAISTHDEDSGATSIGDGIELAHNTINPVTGYDHKALVVFTDGHENRPKYIADVAGALNERVFAVGLGRADQLDVAALDAITSGSGGFLVVTGDLDVDDLFRVSKYFLQVLAGVTNAEIVLDPEASILPGQQHRIPFELSEADYRGDVVLLSPAPWAINFALETPDGRLITATDAAALPRANFVDGTGIHFYRFELPLLLNGTREHGGTWHAVLKVDDSESKQLHSTAALRRYPWMRLGVPYSLSVYARSTVSMRPFVVQSSYEPGATVTLRAVLSQYELPIQSGAMVRVALERPDGTTTSMTLARGEPGVHEGSFVAAIAGVYRLRFLAWGTTLAGFPFTREALRTAGVTPGGDDVVRPSDDAAHWERICELMECLLSSDGLRDLLARLEIDEERLLACIQRVCGRTPERTKVSPELRATAVADLASLLDRPAVRSILAECVD